VVAVIAVIKMIECMEKPFRVLLGVDSRERKHSAKRLVKVSSSIPNAG
jgi:hypothetical protein